MKRKLLEFGGAAVVLLGILGILYLVLGRIGNGPPEVGSVTIRCGEESVIPLGNEIYRTEDGKKREERRLVPEEIGEEAPLLAYNDDITAKYEGNSENGSFYFTIYTDEFQGYTKKKSWFTPLEEPGNYLVCIETYWGTEKNNIGMEYYFWLQVE